MDSGTLVQVSPPTESARAILRRRIMPLPIPYGEKNPNRPGWERERYTEDTLQAFVGNLNIGMLLGHVVDADGNVLTDRFIDADLDTLEAIRAAPFYLPKTNMIWGRASKPRSHYGYRVLIVEGAHHAEFRDPTPRKILDSAGLKAMLCELRFTGKQTLAPGSVNASNGRAELVWWDPDGDGLPSDIAYDALLQAMNRVGAAALLARYWSDGVRHQATLPLAGLLNRGGMTLEDAETFVRAVCTAAGEDARTIEDDRLRCVRDTYARASMGQPTTATPTLEDYFEPRIVALVRKWLALSKTAYGGDAGPDGWPLSDIGNAERFAEMHRGKLLYCDDDRAWYWYDGKRWALDRQNRVYLCSVEVVNAFRTCALEATNSPPGSPNVNKGNTSPEQWAKHLSALGQMRQVRAMQEGAQALLAVLPEEFDTDPLVLNVQNGTLVFDITTGDVTLRDHRAEDMLTMLWAAPYIEGATHPLIEDFLNRFYPEPERRRFLEEAIGYSITGLPKRWSIQLLGPTHAGKGMTLHVLHKHAGDYGATLSATALLADPHGGGGDKPRSDLLGLVGKRVVTIAEIPPGAHFDVALFKTLLSGGDRLLVRAAHARRGREVEFAFTLWTSGNEVYGPSSKDGAAFGRLAVLKCDHAQPDDAESNGDLLQFQTENPAVTGPAFLSLAVRGFRRVYGEGKGKLSPPEVVRQATSDTRNLLDPWSPVIEEMVVVSAVGSCGIAKTALWACAKEAWIAVIGPRAKFSERDKLDFESSLERRGAVQTRRNDRLGNRAFWKGVTWTETAEQLATFLPEDWFSDEKHTF